MKKCPGEDDGGKQMSSRSIIEEVPGFYRIIALAKMRETPDVTFDVIPQKLIPRVDGIDRVYHRKDAVSPGPVNGVSQPWYMHFHQDDNLMVLHGARHVDIYVKSFGRILSFEVTPFEILKEGELIYSGPAMLVWPCGVFHRICSGADGSMSVNFATRYEGFDIKTNFNIYDLDPSTGEYRLLREGSMDQFPVD
jgi:hypothetical protein